MTTCFTGQALLNTKLAGTAARLIGEVDSSKSLIGAADRKAGPNHRDVLLLFIIKAVTNGILYVRCQVSEAASQNLIDALRYE